MTTFETTLWTTFGAKLDSWPFAGGVCATLNNQDSSLPRVITRIPPLAVCTQGGRCTRVCTLPYHHALGTPSYTPGTPLLVHHHMQHRTRTTLPWVHPPYPGSLLGSPGSPRKPRNDQESVFKAGKPESGKSDKG